MKILKCVLMVCLILFVGACSKEDEQYIKTNLKLGKYTIYESTKECYPVWNSTVLFETDTYQYVYYNQCPIGHYVKVDNRYIEITKYISENNIAHSIIENSGIGVKEDKENNIAYIKTDLKLGEHEIYEYTQKSDVECATWDSTVLFETDSYQYLYYNQCPKGHYVKVDNRYIEITRYISENNIKHAIIEDSGIGVKKEK